jgi:hypothetical protein
LKIFNIEGSHNEDKKKVVMNIDAANNWPIVVAPLPGEKTFQNESAPPILFQNHQRPTVPNHGSEVEPDMFRSKGSIIDIYI